LADVRRPSLLFGVLRRRRRGSAVSKTSCRTALGHSSRAISPGSSASRLGTVAPAELVIVAISHRRIERGPLQLGLMLAIRIAAVKAVLAMPLGRSIAQLSDADAAAVVLRWLPSRVRARGTRRPIRASILPDCRGSAVSRVPTSKTLQILKEVALPRYPQGTSGQLSRDDTDCRISDICVACGRLRGYGHRSQLCGWTGCRDRSRRAPWGARSASHLRPDRRPGAAARRTAAATILAEWACGTMR
jgi:hypothetical protein